ncbi:hypothetical protein KMZ68_24690 [Bradyrhizobium sediminis]|uniref:Uncharacterized protein n=1 Tax=Bradyrhizobium sediminis TaxID=2840469 RepID=A0A975RSJ7_9BRAD|nr:hypothetical protein [Bradyrhizobium sediminis]QWG18104.1 hypothetical protein KMZ68_24690 [Bradyrhizobium sediminis]
MNSVIQLNVATARRFTIATTFGALMALGVAGAALLGSLTPAAAEKAAAAGYIPKPDIRDHRTKPVVRDHRAGTATETRDHREGSASGGVTVTEGKRRPRKVPCYGNLCGVF